MIKLQYDDDARHRVISGDNAGAWVPYSSISQLVNLRGFSGYWEGTFEEGVYEVKKVSHFVEALNL